MLWIAVAILCLSPFVAHAIGAFLGRRLVARSGRIGLWMPTIPDRAVRNGRHADRWERRRRKAEGRFLRQFADQGVSRMDKTALAAAIGDEESIADAVLSHLREEVPCRLRVTEDGRLLHDFSAGDLQRLRVARRRSWPLRFAVYVLGVFANIGAAWPVIFIVLLASMTLSEMAGGATQEEALFSGVAGLIAILVAAAVAYALGWVAHLLLTPVGIAGPRLGDPKEAETEGRDTLDPWIMKKMGAGEEKKRGWFSGSSAGSGGSWLDGLGGVGNLGDVDVDGEGCVGCLLVIVVALLVAVIAGGLAVIVLWIRGVYRAIRRAGDADPMESPASWIRRTRLVDWVERLLPMNDLVLRVIRVVRRSVTHTHPVDGMMVNRVLLKARQKGGRISVLELQLFECVDRDTAMSIGARLISYLNGEIVVSDDGEVEFVFPPQVLVEAHQADDQDMGAEYISFGGGQPRRRKAQKEKRLPVNLPGLAWGHVVGTDRLVGGTLMMAGLAIWLAFTDAQGVPGWVVALGIGLPVLAVGTFALAATARYISRASALLGIRRDVRRAGVFALRRALNKDSEEVDFQAVAEQMTNLFRGAYPDVELEELVADLDHLALDLELEVGSAESRYKIENVAERRHKLADYRQREDVAALLGRAPSDGSSDEVVFDSGAAVEAEVMALY